MVDYCNPSMAVTSPSFAGGERKHWWLTNRKVLRISFLRFYIFG